MAASADTAEEMTEEQVAAAREEALAALEKPLEKMKIKVDYAHYSLADRAALHMSRTARSCFPACVKESVGLRWVAPQIPGALGAAFGTWRNLQKL